MAFSIVFTNEFKPYAYATLRQAIAYDARWSLTRRFSSKRTKLGFSVSLTGEPLAGLLLNAT
jgi:hypothetical protein